MDFYSNNFLHSTEPKKKINYTALSIQTNEVDPEGFLNEISSLDTTTFTKDEIDSDFVVTETPTKEELEEKTFDFIKVLCLWC